MQLAMYRNVYNEISASLYPVSFVVTVTLKHPDDDTVLIEGVLFRCRYLGSTTLISEGTPSKSMRMIQAQEAVGRIKVGMYSS